MARRQIGKCRFYCDIPSYLKSIGMYYGVSTTDITQSDENIEKVYTMNPYQTHEFLGENNSSLSHRFWINQNPDTTTNLTVQTNIRKIELNKIFNYYNNSDGHHSSGWYAGILGHNLGSLSNTQNEIHTYQTFAGLGQCSQTDFQEIVNYEQTAINTSQNQAGKAKYDGYSLWEITGKYIDSDWNYNFIEFTNTKINYNTGTDTNWSYADTLKIGAYTTGIFFEPEHAFELAATATYSQEGIKTQTTLGGSTISNINYLGVPNWGDQPAWTLQKTDGRDYTTVANRARRQWKVGLSFIADDNMFDKAGNANKFYNDSFDDGVEDAYSVDNFDTSLSSMFKLTQMGNLPFIFCPNSTAVDSDGNDDLEFAICRITNKPSFKQVANNLFSTSLVLTETW